MRFPSIRLRRTLTIRSLMIVVALVAIGFAGWNAKVRWSFCMSEAKLLGRFAYWKRKDAVFSQQFVEILVESVKGHEQLLDHPHDYESELKDLELLERYADSPEDAAAIPRMKADSIKSKEEMAKMARDIEESLKKERADIVRYRRQAVHEVASAEVLKDFERCYRRAAWRPWIDTRHLRHDVSKFFEDERRFSGTSSDPPKTLPDTPSDSAVRSLKRRTAGPMAESIPPNPAPPLR